MRAMPSKKAGSKVAAEEPARDGAKDSFYRLQLGQHKRTIALMAAAVRLGDHDHQGRRHQSRIGTLRRAPVQWTFSPAALVTFA